MLKYLFLFLMRSFIFPLPVCLSFFHLLVLQDQIILMIDHIRSHFSDLWRPDFPKSMSDVSFIESESFPSNATTVCHQRNK